MDVTTISLLTASENKSTALLRFLLWKYTSIMLDHSFEKLWARLDAKGLWRMGVPRRAGACARGTGDMVSANIIGNSL